LFQELQRRLSFRIDEASKALETAKQGLLDALVDSTFKFSDQPMLPSEVLDPRIASFPIVSIINNKINGFTILQNNFAPVNEISEAIEILQIEGEIPEDFPEGVYIRNGGGIILFLLQYQQISITVCST
jgi:hypothetical protein